MTKDKTGGPAFPANVKIDYEPTSEGWDAEHKEVIEHKGMTLLDYFAAKAMQVIFNNNLSTIRQPQGNIYKNRIAEVSYDIAQAMINERNKREQNRGD